MVSVTQAVERIVTPCMEKPELFFPEGYLGKADPGDSSNEQPDYNSEEATTARALCAGCPLRQKCLSAGVNGQEPYGIWGGLDPDELVREGIRRAM